MASTDEEIPDPTDELIKKPPSSTPSRGRVRDCATLAILIFINLLNYTDRWTLAATITNLENGKEID